MLYGFNKYDFEYIANLIMFDLFDGKKYKNITISKNDNQILITLSNYGINSVYETISGGGSNAWVDIEGDLPDIPVNISATKKG